MDIRGWQEAPFPAAHCGHAWAAAFSPHGDQLATGGDDGVVRVWDLDTGRLGRAFALPCGPGGVTHLAWPGPDLFVTAGGETWRLGHGFGPPTKVEGLGKVIDAIGRWLVVRDPDTPRGLRWWRVPKAAFTKRTLGGPDVYESEGWRLAADAPGSLEVSGGNLVLSDVTDGHTIGAIPHPEVASRPWDGVLPHTAVARDGTLAFGCRGELWVRPRDGAWRSVALPAGRHIGRLTFSFDSRQLAVVGHHIDVVDVANADSLRMFDRVVEAVDVVCAARGTRVHVLYAGLGVATWCLRERKRVALHRLPEAVGAGTLARVVETPEGLLAVLQAGRGLITWDVATDTPHVHLPDVAERDGMRPIVAWPWVTFGPASGWLQVWDARAGACVWAGAVGRVPAEPVLHASGVLAIAQRAEHLADRVPGFRPGEGGVRVLPFRAGTERCLEGPTTPALALSPDAGRLALAGETLDLATGRSSPVSIRGDVCAWSPDGMRLAAAGRARTVFVWHDGAYATDELIGHRAPPRALAFSADGRRLVSVGGDGQVCVWSAATGRRLAVLPGFVEAAGS
jgi:hypothetical protein